jgi:CRP/FNR family transcriptional regulator
MRSVRDNTEAVILERYPASPPSPGLERIAAIGPLPPESQAWVRDIEASARSYAAGDEVFSEGNPIAGPRIMSEGWSYSYKLLPDGRRQILDFVLPGDWFGLLLERGSRAQLSHAMATDGRIAELPAGFAAGCDAAHPALAQNLRRMRQDALGQLADHIVSLGRRSALEAVALLLARIMRRLEVTGLADGRTAPFPLTQELIGDYLGLSVVHVNRTLRKLRLGSGVRIAGGTLTIENLGALEALAGAESGRAHDFDLAA